MSTTSSPFNERPSPGGTGKISHERMVKVVHERYDVFDAQRRSRGLKSGCGDINELEQLAEQQNKREAVITTMATTDSAIYLQVVEKKAKRDCQPYR